MGGGRTRSVRSPERAAEKVCVHESDAAADSLGNDRVDRSARARGGAALAAGSSAQASTAYTCTGGAIPSRVLTKDPHGPRLCSVAAPRCHQRHREGRLRRRPGRGLRRRRSPSDTTSRPMPARWSPWAASRRRTRGTGLYECAIDPGTLRDHRQGKRHGQQRARLPPERCHRPGQGDVIRWRFRADPWSIKNSTISGNLTVSGQRATFLGVLVNTVGKNVTLTNIAITDSDPGPASTSFATRSGATRLLRPDPRSVWRIRARQRQRRRTKRLRTVCGPRQPPARDRLPPGSADEGWQPGGCPAVVRAGLCKNSRHQVRQRRAERGLEPINPVYKQNRCSSAPMPCVARSAVTYGNVREPSVRSSGGDRSRPDSAAASVLPPSLPQNPSDPPSD